MDKRLSKIVMGIPVIPTRRLILSKPNQQNRVERNDTVNAVSIKNHVGLGPRLMEIVKHKLKYGSRVLPLGSQGKIFRKSFSTRDGEKLHTSQCYIYTTAGAIAGILFVSTERIVFCSDKSLKTYSSAGELIKFQYKVSIPLEKMNRVGESRNLKRPSNKYVELVTVDDFNFWFLGFPNYKKTVRCLCETISRDCLIK